MSDILTRDDLAHVLMVLSIEIVATLSEDVDNADQKLESIANGLLEQADEMPPCAVKEIVTMLSVCLIQTESPAQTNRPTEGDST